MTTPDFEAPKDEAPRRVIEEFPDDLAHDLKLYEVFRAEKERDTHIAYARSAAQQIADGLPLHVAIQYMVVEIPYNNFDRHQLISFLNHLLVSKGVAVTFDTSLNAYEGDLIVSSGEAETALSAYERKRSETESLECQYVAQRIGELLMGSMPFDIVMSFAKADIVYEGMDNEKIAAYINRYLEDHNSDLRVDRYLERIS